jgi:hypothetical protein
MAARKHNGGKPRPHNPPHPARSRQRVEQRRRQVQALDLRLAGANFEQIASALGYKTRSAAYKLVEAALAETIREPAEAYRQQELARLDRLLLSVWTQATTPGQQQLVTIDRVLRIMSQRLFYVSGLKVPETVAEVRPDGTSVYDPQVASQEFQQLMASLTLRSQQEAAQEEREHASPAQ